MKYKNRLTFAYYSITFWDIKNLQSVPKIWKVLKSKNKFFKKMFKYRNTFCYDFKSPFLVIFSSNYRHHLVLKIPFPDHIFSKISKYRTENLHFPSIGKYYAPSPLWWPWLLKNFKKIKPKIINYRSHNKFSNEYYKKYLFNELKRKTFVKNDQGFEKFCDMTIILLNKHAPPIKRNTKEAIRDALCYKRSL